MGLLTHPAQSLAISQALTKALCFCASENSLTALFGSYPECYSCNKFREKINWNVDGMYFVLETFFDIHSRLLYSEYYFRQQRNSLQYYGKYMFSTQRKNSWLISMCLFLRLQCVIRIALTKEKLPAGHSRHLGSLEEALTNVPSEHGSNLCLSSILALLNPDCLNESNKSSTIILRR